MSFRDELPADPYDGVAEFHDLFMGTPGSDCGPPSGRHSAGLMKPRRFSRSVPVLEWERVSSRQRPPRRSP